MIYVCTKTQEISWGGEKVVTVTKNLHEVQYLGIMVDIRKKSLMDLEERYFSIEET